MNGLLEKLHLKFPRLPEGSIIACTHYSTYSFGGFEAVAKVAAHYGVRLVLFDKTMQRMFSYAALDDSTIEEIAGYSACVEANMFWDEFITDSTHDGKVKSWAKKIRSLASGFDRELDRIRPMGVLIFQGYLLEDSILRALAKKRDLKLLSIERTLRKDRLLWDSVSGITVNRNEGSERFAVRASEIQNPVADETSITYLSSLKRLKQGEHASPTKKFEWSSRSPKILFLGQVYTDASLLYGLKGFNNPVDVISAVMQWSLGREASLLIKFHPKEHSGDNPVTLNAYDDLTYRKLKSKRKQLIEQMGESLILDRTNIYDTYDLIQKADLVVTVNSQAGLEAAIMGKPVLTGSCCFYGGFDFTYEYHTEQAIGPQMDLALSSGAPDVARARKFFHFMYEEYCVEHSPDSLLTLAQSVFK